MAWSTPTSIGSSTADTGGDASIALTTSGAAPSGAKVFVLIAYFQSGVTCSGISDNGPGLTWTIDHQSNTALGTGVVIASADAPSGLASGTVITANFSATINFQSYIAAMSATGGKTGNFAYGAVHQEQSSTASWSSTGITVASGDLLIGISHWEDSVVATSTPSGGNTEVHDINAGGGSAMTTVYQVGTGASIAAQGTWSVSAANLNSAAVAYPVAAGASTKAPAVRSMSRRQQHLVNR